MYKYIKDGAEITWNPLDKNLGIQIVSEVTNQRKADKNGYVEVTEEERIRIQELYEERNTDPTPVEPVNPNASETLTKQIVDLKMKDLEKDKQIETLTKQIVSFKVEMMKGAN